MENTKRCPKCHQVPEVKVDNAGAGYTITLVCQEHGHMAMGSSLDAARAHWNQYISFVEAEAA